MGFFKEFKNDFSQAVNELLPDDNANQKDSESEEIVNTLDMNQEADSEKMKEWLEEFAQDDLTQDDEGEQIVDTFTGEDILPEEELNNEEITADDEIEEHFEFEDSTEFLVQDTNEINEKEDETMEDNVDLELFDVLNADETETKEADTNVADIVEKEVPKVRSTSDDEITVIAKGTVINGSISSDGALDVLGTVNGDVECLGKLSITGKVKGNTSAAEVYVNTDRIEGSIISEGSVKVGLGTVVLGDITGTSGVIAGAVKGEIDVNGPIVIDSTAIIKGNIKAKSVQINNGAVIEGFCSLSYSEINVDNIFE